MEKIFNNRYFEGCVTYYEKKTAIVLKFVNDSGQRCIKVSLEELGVISIPIFFFSEYHNEVRFYMWNSLMLGECVFREFDNKFYLYFIKVMAIKESMIILKEITQRFTNTQEMQCGIIKSYQSYQNILSRKEYVYKVISQLEYEYAFNHQEYKELLKQFDIKVISKFKSNFDKALYIMRVLHKVIISRGQTAFIPKCRSGLSLLMAKKMTDFF